MTKKGATFNWTKECDTAFKLLKEKLMEDLVLNSPGNFDKTQVKWNITEKEAYTIYKSVKKFAFYITGAKTTVFSDHKPLKNFFVEV